MDPRELRRLESMTAQHPEIEELLAQHRAFELELDEFASRRWLTPTERADEARLKRLKLAGRDRMQQLLDRAATNASA